MALFLDGTTAPQAIWTAVGVGIRAALEVGVHRKKMYASTPIVEEELWRRAFWYTLCCRTVDRLGSDLQIL